MSHNHLWYRIVGRGRLINTDFIFIYFNLEPRRDEVLDTIKVHKVTLWVSQQYSTEGHAYTVDHVKIAKKFSKMTSSTDS